jgi:crotonobetainyl-CoA:carnitine CoA-transferase CaiB-like acyl-CoA transferase
MMTSGRGPDDPKPRDVADHGLRMLADYRVVDFSQALSGPYCTLMLGDLGADVVKVESPERGDDSRYWGPPFVGADAAYFMSINRNKRSITLDLKNPEDFRKARTLLQSADVVVENWRPGTAARLGLGADELRADFPRLVYCSISGFGQDQGPRSGYDQVVQGTSGAMTLTGHQGEPMKWGIPVADIAAGMFAATAILAALLERNVTGRGRTIDIAMQDTLISMLTHHAGRYLADGQLPVTAGNGHATITPYGLFRSKDGMVNICVGNDSQYQRMCQALGRDDLSHDPRYTTNPERVAHKAELLATIESTLADLTTSDILAAMEHAGVPAGAVVDVAQVLGDPMTISRRMIVNVDRDDAPAARAVNTPWKFDGESPIARLAPPHLGEHNRDFFTGPTTDDSTEQR